ncbi:MAG: biotin--[acetyl-CoA-carboxylase] ligase [Chlamydiae bacterium]|nr:biotin--[acetyl-CoA-carboxylase] ligase [Chlamydiota bacterium]
MQIQELHFDSIDSTQLYAKREVATFAPDRITCVVADEQTEGHGRMQRKWISPKGVNLYATFCFRLPLKTPNLESLAIVMAHSFASLLLKENLHPKIKWPNDVQLGGKKVAGVLSETIFEKDCTQIFLGIGINVNMDQNDLNKIDQPATSLKVQTHRMWNRVDLLHHLEEHFLRDLKLFQKEGFKPFHQKVSSLLAYQGETIYCFDGKKTWEGTLESIGLDGRLKLRMKDGTVLELFSADVSLNQPR